MQTMDGIFTNLKRMFQSGNILSKLDIYKCRLVYLDTFGQRIVYAFNVQRGTFLQYLQLPASRNFCSSVRGRCLLYMFTHFDFLHILFNMLWLYCLRDCS